MKPNNETSQETLLLYSLGEKYAPVLNKVFEKLQKEIEKDIESHIWNEVRKKILKESGDNRFAN